MSTAAEASVLSFTLDRKDVVPKIIGDLQDFLVVTGLAGAGKDVAALSKGCANAYSLFGAMGGATTLGLGLAIAQPDRSVLVVTGDGELLMNVGALATISVLAPPNLSILCVDNGHYGETGNQVSHTGRGVDLERMASGAGIAQTFTVNSVDDLKEGRDLLRDAASTSFVLLRISDDKPPTCQRNLNAADTRLRFRAYLGV